MATKSNMSKLVIEVTEDSTGRRAETRQLPTGTSGGAALEICGEIAQSGKGLTARLYDCGDDPPVFLGGAKPGPTIGLPSSAPIWL